MATCIIFVLSCQTMCSFCYCLWYYVPLRDFQLTRKALSHYEFRLWNRLIVTNHYILSWILLRSRCWSGRFIFPRMVDSSDSIKHIEDSRSFSQAELANMKYQQYQSRLLNAKCKVFNTRSNCEISLNVFLEQHKSSLTINLWTNSNEFENSNCLSGAYSKRLFCLLFFRCIEVCDSDLHMMLSNTSQNENMKNQKFTWSWNEKNIDSTICKHLRVNPLQLWAWFKHNFLKQLMIGATRLCDWFNRLDWLRHDNSFSVRPWTCTWFQFLQLWHWFEYHVIKKFRSCEVWNANRLSKSCNIIYFTSGLEFLSEKCDIEYDCEINAFVGMTEWWWCRHSFLTISAKIPEN
jgi:hypothetical protein